MTVTQMPEWAGAECAQPGVEAEIFFPEGKGGHTLSTQHQAKAICNRCPLLESCLAYALNEPIGHTMDGVPYGWMEGVWGGTTAAERAEARASSSARFAA